MLQAVGSFAKQMRIDIRDLENDKRAIIQGTTCDEVLILAQEIAEWKATQDSQSQSCHFSASLIRLVSQTQNQNSSCEYDITDCLPKSVRRLVQIGTAKFDGPQCFNTALVAAGLTPALRTMGYSLNPRESEINGIMNSPLCKKVNLDERKIGDIGILKLKQGSYPAQSNHALIYIGHGITFSKANITRNSKIDFKTIAEEAQVQRFLKSIVERDCEDDPTLELCKEGFEYYRCQTFNEYVLKNKLGENFNQAILLIEMSENELGQTMANGKFLNDVQIETIRNNVNRAVIYLERQKNKYNMLTDVQKVVLKSLAFRLSGMAGQLWFNQGYILPADRAGMTVFDERGCSYCTEKFPQSYYVLSKNMEMAADKLRNSFLN